MDCHDNDVRTLLSQLEAFRVKSITLFETCKTLQSSLAEANVKIQGLEKNLAQFKDKDEECKKLQESLDETKRKSEQFLSKLNSVVKFSNKKLSTLSSTLRETQAKNKELESRLARLTEFEEKYKELESGLDEANEANQKLIIKLGNSAALEEECRALKVSLENAKIEIQKEKRRSENIEDRGSLRIVELDNKCKSINSILEDVMNRNETLEAELIQFDALKENHKMLRSLLHQTKDKCNSLQTSLVKVNAENKELKIKLSRSEEEAKDLTRIAKKLQNKLLTNPFYSVINRVQQNIRTLDEAIYQLNNHRICDDEITLKYIDDPFKNKERSNDCPGPSTSFSKSSRSVINRSSFGVDEPMDCDVDESPLVSKTSSNSCIDLVSTTIPKTLSSNQGDLGFLEKSALNSTCVQNDQANLNEEIQIASLCEEETIYQSGEFLEDKIIEFEYDENDVIELSSSDEDETETNSSKQIRDKFSKDVSTKNAFQEIPKEPSSDQRNPTETDVGDLPSLDNLDLTSLLNKSLIVSPIQKKNSAKLFKCLICEYDDFEQRETTFKSYSSMNEHIKKNHPNPYPPYLRCPFKIGSKSCDRHFRFMQKFQQHVIRNHKQSDLNMKHDKIPLWLKSRVCNLCNKWYLSANNFEEHMSQVHSISAKVTNTKNERSYSLHLKKKRFQVATCLVCKKENQSCDDFKSYDDLDSHIFQYHPNPSPYLRCPICPPENARHFQYATRLSNHIIAKHPGEPSSFLEKSSHRENKSDEHDGPSVS